MVLTRDVAPTRDDVERRDILRTVSVFQLDGFCTSSQTQQLMTETNSKHRLVVRLEELAEMRHRLMTMRWIPWSIRHENPIVLVRYFVNRVIVRKDSCIGTPSPPDSVRCSP